MKTHFKKVMDPNFLGSWDLLDKDGKKAEITATITKVDQTTVKNPKGEEDHVMTLHLKGLKPMICNSTNAKSIVDISGSEFIEDWVGISMIVFIKNVYAFGANHDALRIKAMPKVKAKETLTPEHAKWAGAVTAIKNNTVTIERLQKTYIISEDNIKKLG